MSDQTDNTVPDVFVQMARRLKTPAVWNEERLFLLLRANGPHNVRLTFLPAQKEYDRFDVGRAPILRIFTANAAMWLAVREDGGKPELAYLTSERDQDYGSTPVPPSTWMPAEGMLAAWNAHWLNRHRDFLRVALGLEEPAAVMA